MLIAFGRQRMRRRAEAEQIENQGLIVPLPAPAQKAAPGPPTKGHRRLAVLRPVPIRAAIEDIGEFAYLSFFGAVAREIFRGGQHPRQKKRGVDRGEFAFPDTLSGDHVEEMVIEALVSRRVCGGALNAVVEESQGREGPPHPFRASHEASLDPHGIGRQGETDGRDARWRSRLSLVRDKAVERVNFASEIVESLALERVHELRAEAFDAQGGKSWVASAAANYRPSVSRALNARKTASARHTRPVYSSS